MTWFCTGLEHGGKTVSSGEDEEEVHLSVLKHVVLLFMRCLNLMLIDLRI